VIGDATPAWAQSSVTLYVASGGTGDCSSQANACGSIQTAITTATGGSYSGDDVTIDVGAGTYTETETANTSSLDSLTIVGAGASATTINGGAAASVFTINGGAVTIDGVTITNGSSGGAGGGIDNYGTLTLTDSSLSGNYGYFGGAIENTGTATVTDSTLSGNTSSAGGAIDNTGTVHVINSTLSNDSTNGIYNTGTVTVAGSTFSNDSGYYGGAMVNGGGGTATVSDSTFSGNSATYGGGIYNPSGTLTVTNSTFVDNGASNGGNIDNNAGILYLGATIVTGSTSGGDCVLGGGTFNDLGYNLDDDGSCNLTATGDASDTPAGLDPSGLQSNGGPTQTIALAPGSPAIGLVTNLSLCPSTDQRGAARPASISCDAGAYDTNGALFGSPSVSSVTVTGGLIAPTVTVTGSGFGNQADLGAPAAATSCSNTNTGSDYGNFSFSDATAGWLAGGGTNCTGVTITSYSATQIQFTFGNGYGNGTSPDEYGALGYGDSLQVNVLGATYSSSVPAYSPAPTISSVTITGALTNPTVTVSGSGFGNENDLGSPVPATYCSNSATGIDYDNNLWISDGWGAGEGSGPFGDCTGLNVSSYTNSQIVFTFGSGYGTGVGQYGVLSPGDSFTMTVLGTTFSGTVPFSETPTIDGVTFGGNPASPTVTVSGSGFGTMGDLGTGTPATSCLPTDTGDDYGNYFYFSDASGGSWQAGQGTSCVGLLIGSYSATQITFTFGSEYDSFGPVRDGDSYSVTLFGVTYHGTASLGMGYTCDVSGFGTTSFPVVVSESPAPPGSIDAGGTFQTAPSAQVTVPASVINQFLGAGATSVTVASQTTAIDGLTAVGGSPSGAVDPNVEAASASNLPLSDTLAANTPFTYDTTYNPVTFQTGPGTGTVFLTPGDIDAEVTFVIHGTPASESIACTPSAGAAALGSVTVNQPAATPTFQVPPATPALQNQVSAGTDGGWGATIANTSTAPVTSLSASVQVTDGNGAPTFDLTGMAASGTTCAHAGAGKLTCSIGTLAAGASDTLDVLVNTTGLPDATDITGSATVTSSNAGSETTTLGAIGVVVIENGNGTVAVAVPGKVLVSTKKTLRQARASVSLTLPKVRISVKKKARTGGPLASGTVTVLPPPVAVTLESLAPSTEPALCPPTGSLKCEGNIIQVVGNFSLFTSKLNPIVATVKFFYGSKVPAGTVYFLKPNGKTVDKLSVCKKTASGYDTPCLFGAEQDLGTTGNKYAQDTVYFTGNDPAMGRR
jgi:hypothetical protein